MKGHIRSRGGRYYTIIELGLQDARTCTTCRSRRLHWVGASMVPDVCPRCKGPLKLVRARRQDQIPGGFARKKDAEAALREALGKLEGGTWTPPTRQTVGEYLDSWLEGAATTRRGKSRSPNTLALYRMAQRAYVKPLLGDVKLVELTPEMLEGFYARLQASGGRGGKGISGSTARHAHSLLRKALGDAVAKGTLARNVAAVANAPGGKAARMSTWSAEQLGAFLGHVRHERHYAAYLTAATTGMRRSELLGLRWRDVDLEGGWLSVRSTLLVIDGKVELHELTKTKSSERSISLDPETVNALRTLRARQNEERLALGELYFDLDLVFARETGEPVSPAVFSRSFTAHARAAGLPVIRLHDLRHTHASLLLAAGVHPKVVQERLGHASIMMTLDVYSHVVPNMQTEAADTFASLIATR